MQPFEQLGAFYLGKIHDLDADETLPEYLLYDSKDLTTHALCVGMTGSGKTGLCLSLLEEAGMDGIPAIAIDPKGDLSNLLLTFPDLRPGDFRPWIDPAEAARQGQTADAYAQAVAARWRKGLADWGQDGARIGRFRDAVDLAIYTPGSSAGRPLTVLKSFDAPPAAVLDDTDLFRDRVASATSGLLSLLDIDADPVRSREFILVSNLLDRAWREHRNLDIAGLIQEIQSPPLEKIGVMEVDTFYPAKDRLALSMTLNSLLASPSFAGWLEGEPLDIKRLLYTPAGKPRISILSIAHLSDAERMFFVTILLTELLSWARSQPGTPSLRALCYMDEVFGYFPPVANPPSKKPMLTLLKQARAFGLGMVLATQNPVDLDYKGLSNCGTWFLGRLQTDRDKQRVLDGLEGASAEAGAQFNRQRMDRVLSGLGSRVFLMNNVHEDGPVVFNTRWVMSYLRGPLTRDQIRKLAGAASDAGPEEVDAAQPPGPPEAGATPTAGLAKTDSPPELPHEVPQQYLPLRCSQPGDRGLVYRPALLAVSRLHFVRATYQLDHWQSCSILKLVDTDLDDQVWTGADVYPEGALILRSKPEHAGQYAPLMPPLTSARNYKRWQRQLRDFLYQTQTIRLWKCASPKQMSRPGETEDDFRIRLAHQAHELRDRQMEKLREQYSDRLDRLNRQIEQAQDRLGREQAEYHQRSLDTAISVGASVLGALFGRKVFTRKNVERASSSARKAGRVTRERSEVNRAEKSLGVLLRKKRDLVAKFERDVERVRGAVSPDRLELEHRDIKPRKSDISTEPVALLWTPWLIDEGGAISPAY